MSAPLVDPLAALLEILRIAARQGAEDALAAHGTAAPALPGPLIDKRAIAHALGVSLATVDRLCRDGRIPFVQVGDVRRFDLAAVRAALEESRGVEPSTAVATQRRPQVRVPGVRLLSRGPR